MDLDSLYARACKLGACGGGLDPAHTHEIQCGLITYVAKFGCGSGSRTFNKAVLALAGTSVFAPPAARHGRPFAGEMHQLPFSSWQFGIQEWFPFQASLCLQEPALTAALAAMTSSVSKAS